MKYYLELTIEVEDNRLYICENSTSYYTTPVEDLDEIPEIVANYIKENIEYRKENQDA
ncbi:MAG: hypothetical protein IKY94_06470 [Lachnospiraceae bacterium]|nr:hypothetical protein [Clostridia bacterium]MBR4982184.1 hypothetical protein [Lachnospiraceae bacterium]